MITRARFSRNITIYRFARSVGSAMCGAICTHVIHIHDENKLVVNQYRNYRWKEGYKDGSKYFVPYINQPLLLNDDFTLEVRPFTPAEDALFCSFQTKWEKQSNPDAYVGTPAVFEGDEE